MFDFVNNQGIRIILELGFAIFTAVLGFLGGIHYTQKINQVGDISNSKIRDINQENK